MFTCLPQILRLANFWKPSSKKQSRLAEDCGQSSISQPAPPPPANTIATTIKKTTDYCTESTRLLVNLSTDRCHGPSSPAISIFTTSDSIYSGVLPVDNTSIPAASHLAPPSPAKSTSGTSDFGYGSIASAGDLASCSGSFSPSGCSDDIYGSSLCDSDLISGLGDDLGNALIEWPEGGNRYFMPVDAITRLVTVDSVQTELERSRPGLPPDGSSRQTAEKIVDCSVKLFAILVLIGKVHLIYDFLNENLDDNHLPFVRDDKSAGVARFKFCSKLHPGQPIKCMTHWRPKWIKDFAREQWCMVAPIFQKGDTIQHHTFDENCVLPFIDERTDQVKKGGFSSVWEITIHPAHQFLHERSDSSKTLNPSFALKRLHSQDRADFEWEVEMLKMFSGNRQHPHLVKLLATYEYKGEYYLLFPHAKANLRNYWEETPLPSFSGLTVEWFLRQCKGIASAILRIHGYQSTQDSLDALAKIKESQDKASTTSARANDRIYGRHGDIKPENILWSDEDTTDGDHRFIEKGILMISDFGLMKYHTTLTQFRVLPERVAGSAAYEPPEVAGHTTCANISRAYDIWSLGCVYLEFVTWLICGWKELDRFNKARGDTFFTVVDFHHPRKVIVNESVQDWIRDLHSKPRCSKFIHDFLGLISNHMLVVDPLKRIHCGPLNGKLSTMVRTGHRNPNYLIQPSFSHALCRRRQTETPRGLAGLGPNEKRSPPGPKEGSPLPQRPSIAKNVGFSAHAGPSADGWKLVSEPTSPTRELCPGTSADRRTPERNSTL